MQITSEQAKMLKNKRLTSFLVQKFGQEEPKIVLYFKGEFDSNTEERVEFTTELKGVENYSSTSPLFGGKVEIEKISFHFSIYSHFGYGQHIKSFLKAIKAGDNVYFSIVAFNGCEQWEAVKFTNHKLYGYINDKCFLLDSYTGAINSASPVR